MPRQEGVTPPLAASEAGAGAPPAGPESAFVIAHTRPEPVPLCPEIRLHTASEMTALWEATEGWLEARGVPPPYWALPWAGGQALARWILDHPEALAGRSVLDVGTGGGLCAIAAARAGAARVVAVDTDRFAVAAARLNAALDGGGAAVEVRREDPFARAPGGFDVVLAGDLWYERHLAAAATGWLRRAATGATVLLGDLGRAYFPVGAVEVLAWYEVETSPEIEREPVTRSAAWRLEA